MISSEPAPLIPPTAMLRTAIQSDSPRLAELVALASHGIAPYLWQMVAQPGEDPMNVGIARLARDRANLSYRNAFVVDIAGDVVATILGYRLVPEAIDWTEVPDLVRPLVELEQLVPESFYINILATLPNYRCMGFASMLLQASHTMAHKAGCQFLSIQVFEGNEPALNLYLKQGFQIVAQRPAVPHACYPYVGDVLLMIRSL